MHSKSYPYVLAVGLVLVAPIVMYGCQKALRAEGTVASAVGDEAPAQAGPANNQSRAGALLWSQNCMRCHNLRTPRERSDREWDVIVRHMRVRGNLTAEEHRSILRFLRSAN